MIGGLSVISSPVAGGTNFGSAGAAVSPARSSGAGPGGIRAADRWLGGACEPRDRLADVRVGHEDPVGSGGRGGGLTGAGSLRNAGAGLVGN